SHAPARARVIPRALRCELELGACRRDVQRGPDHHPRDLLPEVLHPECCEQRDQGLARSATSYASSTVSRHAGTAVAKPRARTFGSKAACASGSPWTMKVVRGFWVKLPSQARSSGSSEWAENPLIERTWQWTSRSCPSIRTCFRSEEHTSELQSRGHLVCR